MRSPATRTAIASTFLVALVLTALQGHAAETSEAEAQWWKQVNKNLQDNPAYAFVKDDPALPRVLIIGDSISIGYTAPVRELLQGKANVHRIPTNGGNTERGLENIDAWLGDDKWDVIHFNWGLHDMKRVKDGKLDDSAPVAITPVPYDANLRKLVARLKETGAKLIWATTTPVPEGAAGRTPGEEVTYNRTAEGVMKDLGVPVNDLHAYVSPELSKHQRKANVHFHDEGSALLGKQVAAVILEALPE